MFQEILVIPHQVGPLPVFGLISWSVIVWTMIAAAMVAWNYRRHGLNDECRSTIMASVIVGLLFAFVLPILEAPDLIALDPNAVPRGLPIRGYGVMLLCGILAGVGLAGYRAQQLGVDADHIYSLAFWMFAGGILGARTFFVVQYWQSFQRETTLATILEIAKVTEGGLVVYGALVGSLIAWIIFCRYRKLPLLAVGDIIAPAMLLGLSLGRIGCLANGCCYGGVCDAPLPSVSFPQFVPPYLAQIETGRILGLKLRQDVELDPDSELNDGEFSWAVEEVSEKSVAFNAGVRAGDKVIRFQVQPLNIMKRAQKNKDKQAILISLHTANQKAAYWTYPELPKRSLSTHPAQIYSSISALLLCAVCWFAFPYLEKDGGTLALMLTFYPVTRFLLEWIRVDEASQLGTSLTISQLVSLGILLSGAALWIYSTTRSKRRVLLAA
jgi:phosphatidylglycerol:prolipoprotein diacylglycerol transferase